MLERGVGRSRSGEKSFFNIESSLEEEDEDEEESGSTEAKGGRRGSLGRRIRRANTNVAVGRVLLSPFSLALSALFQIPGRRPARACASASAGETLLLEAGGAFSSCRPGIYSGFLKFSPAALTFPSQKVKGPEDGGRARPGPLARGQSTEEEEEEEQETDTEGGTLFARRRLDSTAGIRLRQIGRKGRRPPVRGGRA